MALKEQLENAQEKLDKISEDIAEIKVVQAEQAADLKHHIRRSDMNEQRIETVENKLIPLIETKNKIEGAFKLIGVVATGLGLTLGFLKVLMELF